MASTSNAAVDVFFEDMCVICRAPFNKEREADNISQVVRGLNTLIEFSCKYKDAELETYLRSQPPVVMVHNSCRKNYVNKRRFDQLSKAADECESVPVQPKTLRSASISFNWKDNCFFCGDICNREQNKSDFRAVQTIEIYNSVLAMCDRRSDALSVTVRSRLMTIPDLRAPDAVYHAHCYSNFRKTKVYPQAGRPVDAVKQDAFDKLCSWLEVTDDELLTLKDLTEKAKELMGCDIDVYSEKTLQRKLQQKYGEHFFIGRKFGRSNVICWREMASFVVNEKWYADKKENIEDDSERIIIAAAKLLKNAIRDADYSMTSYPTSDSIRDKRSAYEWVPSLLRTFLDNLVCPELKKISLGHSIVQAVRPTAKTVISPVLFGTGVSVDHTCASKGLIQLLFRLGYSVSYDEVSRFKQSVVKCDAVELPESYPQNFTQYAADNVDHDICTLDGLNTLHAMGIISMSTPMEAVELCGEEIAIPREKRCKVADVVAKKSIPIQQCCLSEPSFLSEVVFKPSINQYFEDLPSGGKMAARMDLLYHTGWLFTDAKKPRPSWPGFMSTVVKPVQGEKTQRAHIRMQPIINLNPNDLSCIYSTLLFVQQQTEQLQHESGCVTFDQPLWLKATDIILTKKMNVLCRMGGFHMEMSFLGSLGTLMSRSGLEEAMQCCYGANTVKHIFTGKAVSRAIRAHFLVEAALKIHLVKLIMSEHHDEPSADQLRNLFDDVWENGWNDEATENSSLLQIEKGLNDVVTRLMQKSRLAKLWLQYVRYVELLKQFIRAERTGDWNLHLQTAANMLNLFAATGHNNYAKSVRLYLQLMMELPNTHPQLHKHFMSGGHVIRRTGKKWAGISPDLSIEQCMMRPLKGNSGVTRGRGATDSVTLTWVRTAHRSAAVHSALAGLTDLEHCDDDSQHAECGKARVRRDHNDLNKILEFFDQNNPFDEADCRLRSLTTGLVASCDDGINCDDVELVGAKIMKKMDDMKYRDIVLKKADQVKTLADVKNLVGVTNKKLNIDSGLLFSRLLIIMERSSDQMEQYFSYELTAEPASLFKDSFLRKSVKSQLTKEILKGIDLSVIRVSKTSAVYVIDGGYLLHAVKWQPDNTYSSIAHQYLNYVDAHYGRQAVVVFDGYCNGPSTKDHEHLRRAAKCSPDIAVDADKMTYNNQATFLANERNKRVFVALLMSCLQSAGHLVYQAEDDADTLIVKTALDAAHRPNSPVIVVANDTDVLVLLLYHYHNGLSDMFMQSDKKTRASGHTTLIPIREVCQTIGSRSIKLLLLIHAVSGCDTTSCMYGHGKVGVWKKLTRATETEALANVLESYSASQEEVMVAGCKLVSLLYTGQTDHSLTHMRYVAYMNMTATGTQLPRPERLPPTENAVRYHLYRVHLQVVQWRSLMEANIDPVDWGWRLRDGQYIPVALDSVVAPDDILNVVRCKCRTETRKPCGSTMCSCRKHGLPCVAACRNCNGTSCENAGEVMLDGADDEADDLTDSELESDDLFEQQEVYHSIVDSELWSDDEVVNDEIFYDEFMEYTMPWTTEEVIETKY